MSNNIARCEYCNYVLVDPFFPLDMRGYYEDTCPTGKCLQFRCARCHGVWSCNGPADCMACCGVTGWPRFVIWLKKKIKRRGK